MTDDCNFRYDYKAAAGDRVLTKGFARILRIFVHAAFPGGPTRLVVEGCWWKVMGTCPIAGTTLVKEDPDQLFNRTQRFMFLDECYQKPVAIWPHDPLNELDASDCSREWYDVIDRNQTCEF
jgi:hypothetical protein